jgi:hypothetical protein
MQTNFSLCSDILAHFLSIFVLFSLAKRENIGMIPWRAIMPLSVVKMSSPLLVLSSVELSKLMLLGYDHS